MSKHEDVGHEPQVTHDRDFAPVNRGADEQGRTDPSESRAEGRRVSGTGVPGAAPDAPHTLPPDSDGVREAEKSDESRD